MKRLFTLPALTTWKDVKYANVVWETRKGKTARVILDPGGASNVEPLKDEDGNEEKEFNFYRHFCGRNWNYRNAA